MAGETYNEDSILERLSRSSTIKVTGGECDGRHFLCAPVARALLFAVRTTERWVSAHAGGIETRVRREQEARARARARLRVGVEQKKAP
jgi:hypothetical protein